MALTKRSFSSVRVLRGHRPEILADMLGLFPEFLQREGVELPAVPTEDTLDYPAIQAGLMGNSVPEDLDDILYLSSHLGTPKNWSIVEEQAKEDRRTLPKARSDLSYVDQAILAETENWPRNRGFLNRANLRVRVHSRSSYVYFPPRMDLRHRFRTPTPTGLEEVRENLVRYFVDEGLLNDEDHGRGIQVVLYDFEKELWFLIRYPGKLKRQEGCASDGTWKSYDYNPEMYDALAYNKVFGDIRMNTARNKDQRKYRIEFGHLIFNEANVFNHKGRVVSLDPLRGRHAEALFGCDDIEGLEEIVPVFLQYETIGSGSRVRTMKEPSGASLLLGNTLTPSLLPPETCSVTKAEFTYRLKGVKKPGKLTLHLGNRIRYDRDGDSVVLEEWLRRREFVHTFIEVKGYGSGSHDAA